ncbi:uncharacterized protein BX664DRAFT_343414 [Halteromyces radiatus]|uniref:uncharacterized protein n=1 Tax=Halteromyces radiatus TaxID=101107 RepID=UPI00221EDD30|nr:uncharacterized protein BX664DRAFT_343414 [Halteromyces radiatus]KAI8077759.1 hypothetical protein BX664DRAFT_343414 [Halteromyces radiatus]
MGGIFISFDEQKHQEADLNIKALATQFGINLGIAILVMIGFCLLRPKHNLVYAPKYKYSVDSKRPPAIGYGYLAWVKPLLTAKDDDLLHRIGYDAVMFLKFLRLLRQLLLMMTIIGLCALIPVNIVATRSSGDWPPAPGIDFLSISGINYINGKLNTQPDLRWYWSPFAATWFFTLMIIYFLHRFSGDYIKLRQQYFQQEDIDTAKTILLSNIPHHIQSDEELKRWIESLGVLPYPIKEALIGHANPKLTSLYEEHELAVEHLEIALASYLNDGTKVAKQRPTMRIGGFLGFGGKKVDVIDYYTKQVNDLDKEINHLRHAKKKAANFGWLSFDQIQHAQACEAALNQYTRHANKKNNNQDNHDNQLDARPSPPARDLIWANLPLDNYKRQMKRWSGRLVYWIFTFVWMIPIGALSATSNLINLIRFIPNSDSFITNNAFLMGIIQAYFTPIIMALFFLLLPYLFRLLSEQQGYRTHTTLDRKVFLKLYAFFIINNLLVFTLVSIFVGIYGQIRALVNSGSLNSDDTSVGEYVLQMAKNISDVSTFWIDYVCVKGLGLTMELCQLMPLVTLSVRKWISRPSPRQLREYARPPPFDYPQGYSITVFFFTIALLYSAMAPLILPFALMYFTIASLVYKYMLMYIYVTKIESGGKIWPALFQALNVGVILFQVVMIIVLDLKGGHLQAYCMIPLPFLTLAYQWFYGRRLSDMGCYKLDTKTANWLEQQYHSPLAKKPSSKSHSLKNQFRDPATHHKLSAPMVHDDVKHLLPQVYHHVSHPKETIEMVKHQYSSSSSPFLRNKGSTPNKKNSMIMDLDDGLTIKFCTMTEKDVIETAVDDDDSNSDSDELDHVSQSTLGQQHSSPTMNSGKFTNIMDTDDETDEEHRGLVQNDHMDQYWQRQDQHSMQSSTSLLSPMNNNLMVRTMHGNVETPTNQDLLDWRMQRKGVTSEFIDIYESLPARPTTEDMTYLMIQQQEEEERERKQVLLRLSMMGRRHSTPLQVHTVTRTDHNDNNNEDTFTQIPRRTHSMIVMDSSTQEQQSMNDQQRRHSQPFYRQYGRNFSKAIQQNDDSKSSIDLQHHHRCRRRSLPSIYSTDACYTDYRRGSWITQLDRWWTERFDISNQPIRQHALERSLSVFANSNGSSSLDTTRLQRSRTMQVHDSLDQQQRQQRHYLDNDSRIRITYYDDLLEQPDSP